MPTVSVIMPTYNAAPFVVEAVASVLAQSFADLELIVVNDASTDETRQILARIADPRLRLFDQPVNQGSSAAFNLGLCAARGEFIARLDSDDIAEPNRLALQVSLLRQSPGITVCGSDMTYFGAERGASDVPADDGEIKAHFFFGGDNILNSTSVFRRDFAMTHHLRVHSGLEPADDLAFWIDCMRAGATFANIKAPLVRYRKHPGSQSGGLTRRLLRDIQSMAAHAFFPSLNQHEIEALLDAFAPTIDPERFLRLVAARDKAKRDPAPGYGVDKTRIFAELDAAIALDPFGQLRAAGRSA